MRTGSFALLALVLATATTTATAQAQTPVPEPTWGPAPPFFPAGARFAVVQGDPSKPGVFTVRLEMPAGYSIPPHFHSTDEHVTVISGTLLLGIGDSLRTTSGNVLASGRFMTAGAREHHYAVARGKTVVQVHGQGPFDIVYVNPKDDPRGAPARP